MKTNIAKALTIKFFRFSIANHPLGVHMRYSNFLIKTFFSTRGTSCKKSSLSCCLSQYACAHSKTFVWSGVALQSSLQFLWKQRLPKV